MRAVERLRAAKARRRTQRWVWATEVQQPSPPVGVELHAVLATWNEADVVGVTVRNALEQGCAAVHLLDNGSTDDTVEVAAAAGAQVVDVFHTDRYDGAANERRISGAIDAVSRDLGAPHVWWLLLDADELVEGSDGSTIGEVAGSLDRSIRVVGSRTVNHYPRADHPMAVGDDPRWFSTNAQDRIGVSCRQRHWKHPLVRWDAAGPAVHPRRGAHVIDCAQRLREPVVSLVSHHYPFRSREATMRRLTALAHRLEGDRWAMGRRLGNAEAVCRKAYEEVAPHDMVAPGQPFAPLPRPPVRPRRAT